MATKLRCDREQSDWQIVEQPNLRIINDETWNAARARIGGRDPDLSRSRGRPPRTLLGGQLKCATCGGAIIAVNRQSYGCGRRKDQGPTACSNSLLFRRESLDEQLLDAVRTEVLTEPAMKQFEVELRSALRAQLRGDEDGSRMLGQQSRLNALSRDISRLIDALISVGNSDALTARLKAAEAEKSELEESLRQAGTPKTRIDLDRVVRDTMPEYRRFVQRLESALLTDADKARVARTRCHRCGCSRGDPCNARSENSPRS